MTPEEIEGHGKNIRRKLNRVVEDSGYKNFPIVRDLASVADDLCELVIALAQNLKEKETANANKQ